jgi:acid stress chaperone HdeB
MLQIRSIVKASAASAVALLFVGNATAQVTLDVAKITCDQYSGYKITDPRNIAIWLNGYFNGKRDNTLLDTQALEANARKLTEYCIMNPQVPVMQAVETLFKPQAPAR